MKFLLPWILMLLMPMRASASHSWTSEQTALYNSRRFIELEQELSLQGKMPLVHLMQLQEHDLSGCRSLHQGTGGVLELTRCLKFVGREDRIGLFSQGRQVLSHDVNLLCPRLFSDKKSVQVLIKSQMKEILVEKKWRPCLSDVWRQVYLTAYANFDADPVGIVAFFRQAQESLPSDGFWKNKVDHLLAAK